MIWLLSALLTGFVAGIGTYHTMLGTEKTNLAKLDDQALLRTYEWQWAGENWYGRVTFEKRNNKNVISRAKVGLLKKTYKPDGTFSFQIQENFISHGAGTFRRINDDRIEVDLRVKKKVVDREEFVPQTISGTLERRLCFAGKVEFLDDFTSNKNIGNMVLVDHRSLTSEYIDNWFLGQD